MNFQHKNQAAGEWNKLSFFEQMANVGSEVGRAIRWKEKGNNKYAKMSGERALELFDLTIRDDKNKGRLKEITRAREVFIDFFFYDNEYCSADESWQRYFYAFNYAARLRK